MEREVVIAYTLKGGQALKPMKKLVRERFPECNTFCVNYSRFLEEDVKEAVRNAEALVISGVGRVIEGNGVAAVNYARANNIPVYFIMNWCKEMLDDQQATMWAYNHAKFALCDHPVVVELPESDEVHRKFYGEDTIVLPTYAM